VLAVRVAVDLTLPLEDLRERLELQVLPHGNGVRALDRGGLRVFLLPPPVVARGEEARADQVCDAHARRRIARVRVLEVGLLRVLAEREFDDLRSADEEQVAGPGPAPPLHALALPADGIGRTVQDVGDGGASGELA